MKTAVASTSIECYHQLRDEGGLSEKRAIVMSVIRPGLDYTIQELVSLSGLPVNTVSGRRRELLDMGLLEHSSNRKCTVSTSKKTVQSVRLSAKQRELQLQ